jgi:hypothetical protein
MYWTVKSPATTVTYATVVSCVSFVYGRWTIRRLERYTKHSSQPFTIVVYFTRGVVQCVGKYITSATVKKCAFREGSCYRDILGYFEVDVTAWCGWSCKTSIFGSIWLWLIGFKYDLVSKKHPDLFLPQARFCVMVIVIVLYGSNILGLSFTLMFVSSAEYRCDAFETFHNQFVPNPYLLAIHFISFQLHKPLHIMCKYLLQRKNNVVYIVDVHEVFRMKLKSI